MNWLFLIHFLGKKNKTFSQWVKGEFVLEF